MDEKYGYICQYKGKSIEIYSAKGKYAVQLEAAKHFKAKKSYEVDVYLCERPNGEIVDQVLA